MSTFYAVFPDPAKGRLAVQALLQQGVSTDDVSLVSGKDGRQVSSAANRQARSPDTSAFVGRADDPMVDQLVPTTRTFEEKFYAELEPYGGGISTASLDADAETVDQTTDPNWIAEEMIERENGETQTERELHDLDLAVNTGYPTKTDQIDDFRPGSVPPVDDFLRGLDQIPVPRLGLVSGGGALATAALDYADDNPADDEDAMMRHFREEGVPPEQANAYLDAIRHGGAVVAVALVPGQVEAPLVEQLADQLGAEQVRTFDAPRY